MGRIGLFLLTFALVMVLAPGVVGLDKVPDPSADSTGLAVEVIELKPNNVLVTREANGTTKEVIVRPETYKACTAGQYWNGYYCMWTRR
jgi:hypothetical protein